MTRIDELAATAEAAKGPLVSPALLFSLAGAVLALIADRTDSPDLALGGLALGLGLLAMAAGMKIIRRWKGQQTQQMEATRAALDLESRLHRHLARIPRPHLRRSARRASMDRQYLTVVNNASRDQ